MLTAAASRRLAGLDGIRAVAVAGVLLYHLDLSAFAGGFLGVDVFFVVSGFLITALLIEEFSSTGSVNIRAFYSRRVRRLVPAIILLLAVVAITARYVFQDAASRIVGDTLSALAYVANWWFIKEGDTYFQVIGRPPLLQHLWSLAIEEQFYILWPALLVWWLRRHGLRRLAPTATLLSIASAAWMCYLAVHHGYPEEADPSRVYFGTDTHCSGLLLGAALASIWRPFERTELPTREENFVISLGGFGALGAVIFAYIGVSERTAFLYRGGFFLLSLATAGVVLAGTCRGTLFSRFLEKQPLRWIGERSYGLYLWHWPIVAVTRPGLDVLGPSQPVVNLIVRLAATVTVTALSYRYVERPIREGALEEFLFDWRSANIKTRRRLILKAAAVSFPAVAVLTSATIALATMSTVAVAMPADVAEAIGTNAVDVEIPTQDPVSTSRMAFSSKQRFALPDGGITALGDSVLLGTRAYLEGTIRGARVDAEVGRQAAGLLDRIRELEADHLLEPTVLLHAGTNGYITERQLRQSLDLLANRHRVILVNTHVPKRWMDSNNELIAKVGEGYANVVIADWASVSSGHPEYFVSDQVHLTPQGQRAFVEEIIRVGGFEVISIPSMTKEGLQSLERRLHPTREVNLRFLHLEEVRRLAAPSRAAHVLDTSFGSLTITAAPYRPLVRYVRPMPLEAFWQTVAQCETRGDWKNPGRFSGGLGIYVGSWHQWGGYEFAPSPERATRAQQIVIANRISTQGWRKADGTIVEPVGFSGWGCLAVTGEPTLLIHRPETVIIQLFRWSQKGALVTDLQAILSVKRTGSYDQATWVAHRDALRQLDLPNSLAPSESDVIH